jgi:hypothetical protein
MDEERGLAMGYRKLTVKHARKSASGERVFLDFEDSKISFELSAKYLKEKGLADISVGQQILIKGKHGNEDHELWGVDILDDLKAA